MVVCLDAAQTSHSKCERFTSGSPWFKRSRAQRPWTTPSPMGKYVSQFAVVRFIYARRYSDCNVSLYFQLHAVTQAWPLAAYNVIPMSATFR